MRKKYLYTIQVSFNKTQELFINQIHTSNTLLNKILFTWVKHALEQELIKGTKDPKKVLNDITNIEKHPRKLENVSNIWRIQFLMKEGLYTYSSYQNRTDNEQIAHFSAKKKDIFCTLDLIGTSTEVTPMVIETKEPPISRELPIARARYVEYRENYTLLKSIANMTKDVYKERKRVEKQLLYWMTKIRFLLEGYNRDVTNTTMHRYTVTMYYRGGNYIRQFSFIRGNDIRFVLFVWVNDVLSYKSKIIAPRDRLMLMKKVSLGLYSPIPIDNLKNVWGTYFTLSEGMAKLTIIKTALDEVVQG